jgi:periplasmic copper chaperone A
VPARIRTLVAPAVALVVLALVGGPALAHVVADPDEVSGRHARTALRIDHGCEGAPTTALRVQIPEGVASVTPEALPGWDVEVIRDPASAASEILPAANRELAHEGEEDGSAPATGRVVEVAWRNGSLPDGQFQEFGLSFQIAEDAPEVLWFPTIQECEEGEHRWIDIPATLDDWGDLAEPAPYVVVASDAAEPVVSETPDTPAAEPDEPIAEAAAPAGDAGVDPLAAAALAVGVLGVALGAAALLRARFRA